MLSYSLGGDTIMLISAVSFASLHIDVGFCRGWW